MQEPGHGKYTQKLLIITILLMHQLSYVRSRIGCPRLDYVCREKKKKGKKNASNFEEHMVLGPLQILPGWKLFARDVTVVCEHN